MLLVILQTLFLSPHKLNNQPNSIFHLLKARLFISCKNWWKSMLLVTTFCRALGCCHACLLLSARPCKLFWELNPIAWAHLPYNPAIGWQPLYFSKRVQIFLGQWLSSLKDKNYTFVFVEQIRAWRQITGSVFCLQKLLLLFLIVIEYLTIDWLNNSLLCSLFM